MSETIWVAIITACASVIPQLIIVIFRYKQEIVVKKQEVLECAKKEALTNFITIVTACSENIGKLTEQQINEYYKCLNILLVYFPNSNKNNIAELSRMLYGSNNVINDKLSPIVSDLSRLLTEKL